MKVEWPLDDSSPIPMITKCDRMKKCMNFKREKITKKHRIGHFPKTVFLGYCVLDGRIKPTSFFLHIDFVFLHIQLPPPSNIGSKCVFFHTNTHIHTVDEKQIKIHILALGFYTELFNIFHCGLVEWNRW